MSLVLVVDNGTAEEWEDRKQAIAIDAIYAALVGMAPIGTASVTSLTAISDATGIAEFYICLLIDELQKSILNYINIDHNGLVHFEVYDYESDCADMELF